MNAQARQGCRYRSADRLENSINDEFWASVVYGM
ncbi:hypothetical protein CORC01_00239 [Colletotrichum orchidophilum]|uniref:Uncharacterized protein n=1 Tax=Colletotrichum orchidophilum TaxID=1209926 RepID=A0A1G4BT05_9PEZI|nr:uncharacterized protein CORC01_00239 [Colletotrichum orchidophilum]OHF04387.1 hypothetical protein CORC01_00239 [Colletotrichum orchidophilum]